MDPLATARSNLSAAKLKLEKLIKSGKPTLVEALPHGVTDVHSRADLENVIAVWQAEVDYHAGLTPPPAMRSNPFA